MSELKRRNIRVTSDRFTPSEYFRNGDWHWSYTVVIVGILGGFFSVFYVGKHTLVDWLDIMKLFLFLALIPLLVPYKIQRKYLKVERLEMMLLHVLGTGPVLLSLLMWLNFFVVTNEEQSAFVIDEIKSVGTGISPGDVEFILKDNKFEEFRRIRIYDHLEIGSEILEAETLVCTLADGCLGYKVVKNVEFK